MHNPCMAPSPFAQPGDGAADGTHVDDTHGGADALLAGFHAMPVEAQFGFLQRLASQRLSSSPANPAQLRFVRDIIIIEGGTGASTGGTGHDDGPVAPPAVAAACGGDRADGGATSQLQLQLHQDALDTLTRQRQDAVLRRRLIVSARGTTASGAECRRCGARRAAFLACCCGGGRCDVCGTDDCACPWGDDGPEPPPTRRADAPENMRAFGFLEKPPSDPYAPSILIVGEYSMAFARECRRRWPHLIAVTCDYRRGDPPEGGLHYCGDARELLWRRRWRLVIGHPPCASAARSNTTKLDERLRSGDPWRGMTFTLLLYCAPADVVVVEQPPTHFAKVYRSPDQVLDYADFGVGHGKKWCLWTRGSVAPAAPTGRAAVATAPAHRIPCCNRDERERLRSVTPPEMARAVANAIDLDGDAGDDAQPIYSVEVERLARGYQRIFAGALLPADYADAQALSQLAPTLERPPPPPDDAQATDGEPDAAALAAADAVGSSADAPQPPAAPDPASDAPPLSPPGADDARDDGDADGAACGDGVPEQPAHVAPTGAPAPRTGSVSVANLGAPLLRGRAGDAAQDGTMVNIQRGTPLGNPFPMQRGDTRADVLRAFRAYLHDGASVDVGELARRQELNCKPKPQPGGHAALVNEVTRLAKLVRDGADLTLLCGCAPRACHGDTLAATISRQAAKMREEAAPAQLQRKHARFLSGAGAVADVGCCDGASRAEGADDSGGDPPADGGRAARRDRRKRGLGDGGDGAGLDGGGGEADGGGVSQGSPAADADWGRMPPTPRLDLTQPPPDGTTAVAIVPVQIQTRRQDDGSHATRLLALVPLARPRARKRVHVFGSRLDNAARRGRREGMVESAAAASPQLGIEPEAYFLAGEVRTHDGDAAYGAAASSDTVVVTAPTRQTLDERDIAESADALRAAAEAGRTSIWATVDAVAAAAGATGSKECAGALAAYRVVAAAVARIDSYLRPTPEGPEFMRIGVLDERTANRITAERDAAAVTLQQRIERAAAAAREFQRLLLAEPHDASDPTFDGWCRELAPSVAVEPTAHLPPELAGYVLPAAPDDLLSRPFQHVALVAETKPLPAPEPQTPPADGWWPHDVHDIVEPEALTAIDQWLLDCLRWHQAGGPSSRRPEQLAFGTASIKPRARGRIWDLRDGPGKVKLFDPTTEPKRTCIDLGFAERLFAECKDRELISMLMHGIQMKTDGLEHQVVLMPNLLSMYSANGGVDAAAEQMDDMVNSGFLGVFSSLPCVPFRCVPRGEVPKKGTTELRGVVDQGQPRKRLRTQDAGDEPVRALNDVSRDADWPAQGMDSLESAALNGAIVQELGDRNGETCIEIALDYSKYFWRFFMDALALWQLGCLVPSKDHSPALRLALEYVMTMGAYPSSAVAQRFSNALIAKIYEAMHAEEAARWADPNLPNELTPACRAALEARRGLPATCYGTQAALFNLLQYCDDARFCVASPTRAMRLLRIFHRLTGPAGLRLPLSRAQKQQTGCCVVWLGGVLAAGLGLVWLPPDKCMRAASAVATALRGELEVGTYRSVLGFLASLVFMVGGDKRLLHHIFRPVREGEEIDGGPATLVRVDAYMAPVLERWLDLLMNTPGAAMVAAARPTPPASMAPRHRIRTDAALQGCESPGIGGWMYGLWFAVPIAEIPGMEILQIPHLELIAAGVGTLVYGPTLAGARHVSLETDALATATTLTERSRSAPMRAILDTLLECETYRALAPRLTISLCWGAGNPLADAASRSYATTMRVLSEALGMPAQRLPLGTEAEWFLRTAIQRAVPLVLAAQQPHRGATELGAPNPSMDGSPRAQDGSSDDEPPSPPMAPPALRDDGGGSGARASGSGGGGGESRAAAHGSRSGGRRRRGTRYADHASVRHDDRPGTPRGSPMSTASPPSGTAAARAAAAARDKRRRASPATPAGLVTPPSLMHAPVLGGRAGDSGSKPKSKARRGGGALQEELDAAQPVAHDGGGTSADVDGGRGGGDGDGDGDGHGSAAASPTAMPPPQLGQGASPQRPSPTRRPALRGGAGRAAQTLRAAREQRIDDMYEVLRADESEHAIRADDDIVRWLAEAAVLGNPEELPLTTQGQRASNWRHWLAYCKHIRIDSPWRPDASSLDAKGLQRENAIWAGALPWILKRMRPRPGFFLPEGPPHYGRPRPPQPQSALNVLRGVRAEHVASGITPPPLQLAARRSHELMLKYMREYGQQNLVEQRKAPLNHQLITAMLAVPNGAPIRKKGGKWRWDSSFGESTRALFHTLAQTGFRKAEIAVDRGEWDNTRLSFHSLRWKIRGKTVHSPSVEQLQSLGDGDFAIIMPPPSKADQYGRKWGNNPIWLPVDSAAAINAALALARWELVACVTAEKRSSTPLFCGPDGIGSALRAKQIDSVFHDILQAAVEPGDSASHYSMHSWRSYLASALMAADCTDAQIQAALRWASEDALKIYKVANREAYGGWLRRAERAKLTGERARTLQADKGRAHPPFENEHELAFDMQQAGLMERTAAAADARDDSVVTEGGVDGLIESMIDEAPQ